MDGAGRHGREFVSIRDVVGRVLGRLDPIEETSRLLDAWAAASGVITSLTIGRTSFWYRARLHHWLWLQERVVWAAVLRELVAERRAAALACAATPIRRSRTSHAWWPRPAGCGFTWSPRTPGQATGGGAAPARDGAKRGGLSLRLSGRIRGATIRRWTGAGRPGRAGRGGRGESVVDRLARLTAEREPRLLVVSMQLPQMVETAAGPRVMSPNLGPVIDRLRGSRLDPIVIDRYANRRAPGPGDDRVLPLDAVTASGPPHDPGVEAAALAAVRAVADVRQPAVTAGIDLGPELARHVADDAAGWIVGAHSAVARIRMLVERLPVRAILVADEYHRQDWLEAAAMAGIPVAAVQHGTIYRRHKGYVHGDRPPELRLPDRTYVFGRWERDLLVRDSVYRADEVVVGGSPRLDLYRPVDERSRDGPVASWASRPTTASSSCPGRRAASTAGSTTRSLLARLFDRPLPHVHLVVKQHPAEKDEGPYRAVVEGVATAGGFAPPPITVVRDVDLYRLLAAADAHLGIHSTVLTEAVFVGHAEPAGYGRAGRRPAWTTSTPGWRSRSRTAPTCSCARGGRQGSDHAAAGRRSSRPLRARAPPRRIADDLLAWLPDRRAPLRRRIGG